MAETIFAPPDDLEILFLDEAEDTSEPCQGTWGCRREALWKMRLKCQCDPVLCQKCRDGIERVAMIPPGLPCYTKKMPPGFNAILSVEPVRRSS